MVEVVNPEASQSLAQRNLESIIRGFARFGVDPDELLREHAARTVGHPFGTPESFLRWNDLYVERLPPLSALFVGADTPFGQWEVVDFLAACYPTVGQSFPTGEREQGGQEQRVDADVAMQIFSVGVAAVTMPNTSSSKSRSIRRA